MRGRSVLVVAHRLSTIRSADVIVVMRHGLVVETGSHASLLASRGAYHALVQGQLAVAPAVTDDGRCGAAAGSPAAPPSRGNLLLRQATEPDWRPQPEASGSGSDDGSSCCDSTTADSSAGHSAAGERREGRGGAPGRPSLLSQSGVRRAGGASSAPGGRGSRPPTTPTGARSAAAASPTASAGSASRAAPGRSGSPSDSPSSRAPAPGRGTARGAGALSPRQR